MRRRHPWDTPGVALFCLVWFGGGTVLFLALIAASYIGQLFR